MTNTLYYISTISSIIYVPLLITGLLLLLFPASGMRFRRKYWPLFNILLAIALISQIVTFGGLSGLEMEYGEQPGFSNFFTTMWPTVMLLLMILVFLTSVYLQSRRIANDTHNEVSLSLAFYIALTISGPLYFLLSALLIYLF